MTVYPVIGCRAGFVAEGAFNELEYENRYSKWNTKSLRAIDKDVLYINKRIGKFIRRHSFSCENSMIAWHFLANQIEPKYVTKNFCIENFFKDVAPRENAGDKETHSSFIMMLPKKICQYIISGIPEKNIMEDGIPSKYKKLLPKKGDEDYFGDQIAILVISNKTWIEQWKLFNSDTTSKGFGQASRDKEIDELEILFKKHKDHPESYLHKPGFKMIILGNDAAYTFADYNWETGTENIKRIEKTVSKQINWDESLKICEHTHDGFEDAGMLFNGLINIAANAILQENREKKIIDIESSGASRTIKKEDTENKENKKYKKPIKWISTDPDTVKPRYKRPKDHVPQKGSPKCPHTRAAHDRTCWRGKGKDKQKVTIHIPTTRIHGNKEKK